MQRLVGGARQENRFDIEECTNHSQTLGLPLQRYVIHRPSVTATTLAALFLVGKERDAPQPNSARRVKLELINLAIRESPSVLARGANDVLCGML